MLAPRVIEDSDAEAASELERSPIKLLDQDHKHDSRSGSPIEETAESFKSNELSGGMCLRAYFNRIRLLLMYSLHRQAPQCTTKGQSRSVRRNTKSVSRLKTIIEPLSASRRRLAFYDPREHQKS